MGLCSFCFIYFEVWLLDEYTFIIFLVYSPFCPGFLHGLNFLLAPSWRFFHAFLSVCQDVGIRDPACLVSHPVGGMVEYLPHARSVQSCTQAQLCLSMAGNSYYLLLSFLFILSLIIAFPAFSHICKLHFHLIADLFMIFFKSVDKSEIDRDWINFTHSYIVWS